MFPEGLLSALSFLEGRGVGVHTPAKGCIKCKKSLERENGMGEQSVHNVFMKLKISQESNITGEERVN